MLSGHVPMRRYHSVTDVIYTLRSLQARCAALLPLRGSAHTRVHTLQVPASPAVFIDWAPLFFGCVFIIPLRRNVSIGWLSMLDRPPVLPLGRRLEAIYIFKSHCAPPPPPLWHPPRRSPRRPDPRAAPPRVRRGNEGRKAGLQPVAPAHFPRRTDPGCFVGLLGCSVGRGRRPGVCFSDLGCRQGELFFRFSLSAFFFFHV